jgi:hypothetical protein
VNAHVRSIPALASDVVAKPLLFPCGISQLKRSTAAFYLDERPSRQDWVLVGCARSQQIHRHVYGDDCPRIELCPKHLFDTRGGGSALLGLGFGLLLRATALTVLKRLGAVRGRLGLHS